MMTKLRACLFSGLLVTVPITITLLLVTWFVGLINNIIQNFVPGKFYAIPYLSTFVPVFAIIFVVLMLILIGALVRGVLGSYMLALGERVVNKMPVVRSIYTGTKQVLEAFIGDNKMSFRHVGLIEYPRKGSWSLCFITGMTKGEVQKHTSETTINLFVPTTPNPTSGFLLFLPSKEVYVLDMTVEEGIKMVVSAGIVTPQIKPDQKPIQLRTACEIYNIL